MTDYTNLKDYQDFVLSRVSDPSMNFDDYIARLHELKEQGCDISMLDTASQGLVAEAGEFEEIVKKIKYQGKPWNSDNHFHLVRELGDAMFYVMIACKALGVSPEAVMHENIAKLEKRYASGKFSVDESENRKEGDI